MRDAPRSGTEGPGGCFAAVAIGILTVALLYGLLLGDGRPIDLAAEWDVIAFLMVIAAIPFLLLAAVGVTAKAPWLVGLALHSLFWGWILFDALINEGAGVNIGLGLLIPLSPIVIAGAALWTAKATGSIPDS